MKSVFEKHREALERHETMMGSARGRLAVALDLLTDSLALVGHVQVGGCQQGVALGGNRCRPPGVRSLDLSSLHSARPPPAAWEWAAAQ